MRNIQRLFLFFVCTLPLAGITQSSMPVFTGKVRSLDRKISSLLVRTDNATAEIYCYSPTVVRVRIIRRESPEDRSHAVIQQPSPLFRDLVEYRDSAILMTDSLRVIIYRDPFRLAFRNSRGELLSMEQPGMPVAWLGSEVTCYRKLFPDEKFLGLGEKTGNLDKRGNSYVNWNSDVPAYKTDHDPLYQSIPFFIGVHGQVCYGLFLDNTHLTRFNFGASTDEQFSSFSAADGDLNYYFFGATGVAAIIRDYTWLTGRIKLPPYWSLGYQQCRWSYFPESQVMSIAQQFRDKQIPCDVIYLDIDYMDAYKIFTWNKERFPQPKAMTDRLKGMGFHLVTIVDPGIKIEKGYFAYDEGVANGHFARYPGGSYYTGSVWPGRCHFPDFTSEKVRKWWGASFNRLTDEGVEGFWNDMNEPSAWGQSIPNLVQFDFDGKPGTISKAHNIYGLEMSRATFEGTKGLMNGKRPFILTRAGYAGIQRYSAVWTGDNEATDDHMILSARMVTGLGLSGVSFTGPDVGGFIGNPTEQLYLRWMSMGVYTPFFRNHSAWDTKSKEPWSFGTGVERQVREMINQRYRLLPYLYSAFHESALTGMPVARSLAIPYTFDEKVYWWKYQNEYLFGENLLVAPVSCNQQAVKIYLPEGGWYRLSSGEFYPGGQEVTVDAPLDDLPVFARASGIIPMQSLIQHTGQTPSTTLEVNLYYGEKPGSFHFYEDDGLSYQYENGQFCKRVFTFNPADRTMNITAQEGSWNSRFKSIRLVLHAFRDVMVISVNGQAYTLKKKSTRQAFVEFPLPSGEVSISY